MQLCNAAAAAPATREAIIAEARGGFSGAGALPLRALLEALPEDAVLSCEIPLANPPPPERLAREVLRTATARLSGRMADSARLRP